MANSVAARGHVLIAKQSGDPIPEEWALDENGRPTRDAAAAAEGMLLPLGGHKGIGLAMLVECLAGSLVADRNRLHARVPAKLGSGAAGGQNAFFWVINPALASERAAFDEDVLRWTEAFCENGGPLARLPGARAAEREAQASKEGLLLSEAVRDTLRELGESLGVTFPSGETNST